MRCGGGARWHIRTEMATALALTLLVASALGGCGLSSGGSSTGRAAQSGIIAPAYLVPRPNGAAMPTADYRVAAVNAMLARMTLDQKLGQLFIVNYPYADANEPDATQMFGQLDAGGVILYHGSNIFTLSQTQALTRGLQAKAAIPLIITADEEGGGDEQINSIFPTHLTEDQIGATGDPRVAAQVGGQIASQLKELGFNADFAPIVDVEAPYRNWIRAFGHSPTLVTNLGAAFVDAMQSQGIMATLKHFPGLGGATVNPHFGLPVINTTRDYIEQNDFAPYRALLSHHPAMIMTTDLLMPALDPTMPAELSKPIVTGILRNEIGYDGVVVTDALYMAGIADHYTIAQAVVLAIQAGNDMVEGVFGADEMRQMVGVLRAAVQSGQLSTARIDQSVRRILLLKADYGLLPLPPSRGQRDVAQRGVGVGAPALAPGGIALAPHERRMRATV
jgi:beta-N-acetylhexosaminidase